MYSIWLYRGEQDTNPWQSIRVGCQSRCRVSNPSGRNVRTVLPTARLSIGSPDNMPQEHHTNKQKDHITDYWCGKGHLGTRRRGRRAADFLGDQKFKVSNGKFRATRQRWSERSAYRPLLKRFLTALQTKIIRAPVFSFANPHETRVQ